MQEREHFGDPMVDGQTILKYFLNKCNVRIRNVLLCPDALTSLYTRQCMLSSHTERISIQIPYTLKIIKYVSTASNFLTRRD